MEIDFRRFITLCHFTSVLAMGRVRGGKKEEQNIIPVYDNSVYFQGYVAQGFHHYYQEDAPHYIFIADDLMLDPLINENNYADYFNLSENSAFIDCFGYLGDALTPRAGAGLLAVMNLIKTSLAWKK